MDLSSILEILAPWVAHVFPSLSEYVKYVGPTIMTLASVLGIFTNILPEPGHVYLVPDTTHLQAELQGSGGFILRAAKFTRSCVVGANWLLATPGYAWFFNTTNKVADILSKVKLAPKPLVKS